jgi:hypothetical protein
MKKLIFLIMLAAVAFSCENAPVDFDDFEKQTIYFPVQYPVRTISLGNDLVDNSLDKEHKFHIGVCVGGFYNNNNRDWRVYFQVEPSLVPNDYLMRDADTLKMLPSSYYTLTPGESVIINKGSFNGLIQVQLNDAFFQDPLAITGRYVIPLRITGSPDTEDILRGQVGPDAPAIPDVHNPSHWDILPKDYTLFGVKYINPYHGKWLRRGKLMVRNRAGQIVSTKSYHAQYLEQNEVVSLVTASLNAVTSSMNIDAERFDLRFEINDKGEIALSSVAGSPISVIYATGFYKENGDAWGGTPESPTPRDAIYLNYFYKRTSDTDVFTCEVSDTLVFRDRGIVFEDERPTIISP